MARIPETLTESDFVLGSEISLHELKDRLRAGGYFFVQIRNTNSVHLIQVGRAGSHYAQVPHLINPTVRVDSAFWAIAGVAPDSPAWCDVLVDGTRVLPIRPAAEGNTHRALLVLSGIMKFNLAVRNRLQKPDAPVYSDYNHGVKLTEDDLYEVCMEGGLFFIARKDRVAEASHLVEIRHGGEHLLMIEPPDDFMEKAWILKGSNHNHTVRLEPAFFSDKRDVVNVLPMQSMGRNHFDVDKSVEILKHFDFWKAIPKRGALELPAGPARVLNDDDYIPGEEICLAQFRAPDFYFVKPKEGDLRPTFLLRIDKEFVKGEEIPVILSPPGQLCAQTFPVWALAGIREWDEVKIVHRAQPKLYMPQLGDSYIGTVNRHMTFDKWQFYRAIRKDSIEPPKPEPSNFLGRYSRKRSL